MRGLHERLLREARIAQTHSDPVWKSKMQRHLGGRVAKPLATPLKPVPHCKDRRHFVKTRDSFFAANKHYEPITRLHNRFLFVPIAFAMGTLFSMALKKMHPIHLKGVKPWRWILWTDCNECLRWSDYNSGSLCSLCMVNFPSSHREFVKFMYTQQVCRDFSRFRRWISLRWMR